MALHLGIIFALVTAIIMYFVIYKSKWGYEIKLTGDNPNAAKYAGINIMRNTILVMALSGAIAGLAGASEISGVVNVFRDPFLPDMAIRRNYRMVVKTEPINDDSGFDIFRRLIIAGREIQPSGIPKMIQGIILVCLISFDFFLHYRIRISRISVFAEE
jgi:simple sugar transport system permease protein